MASCGHSHRNHHHHHSLLRSHSSSLEMKRTRWEKKNKGLAHQIKNFSLYLNTCFLKDFNTTKMNLDNYNGLTNLWEYVQNVRSNLELVIHDSNAMCKILSIIFYGFIWVWYHVLELSYIFSFFYLSNNVIACFSISILVKKSSTKLFSITHHKVKMKRFNKEMLKVEGLIGLVAIEALINGIHNYSMWKWLHAFLDRTLLIVQQAMEKHIRVEEVSVSKQEHSCFHRHCCIQIVASP